MSIYSYERRIWLILEGLFRLGYITEEVYEAYEKRYSEPLVKEKPKPLSLEQIGEQEEIKQLERLFSEVSKQWPNLTEKAKMAHLAKAKEYVNSVSNAKLILTLANINEECLTK